MPSMSWWACLRLFVALSFGFLSACATIVEGNDQTVTVMTQPPGATCKLVRGETVVAVVNPTPGSIQVEKSHDDISVLCEMEDHESGAGTLASRFEGMTFGNILFGGLIGVAVDAGSGAMHDYPGSITLIMPPKQFGSASERDKFYDNLVASVRLEAKKAEAKIRENCDPDQPDMDAQEVDQEEACQTAIQEVEHQLKERLAELEQMRLRARIAQPL